MSARTLPGLSVPLHGTVMRLGGHWIVACPPHVMGRLKRWFPRISSDARGEARLKRSREVDRDLQAFLDRFPMEIAPEDLAELHGGAEAHRRQEREVASVLSGTYTPAEFPELGIVPREYQRVAADLWVRSGGMLLGDHLGLGKTYSALVAFSRPALRPGLVVCPTHLPEQWREAAERCLPGIRCHVLEGTTPYDIAAAHARWERRHNRQPGSGFPDLVICPYSRIHGWAEALDGKIKAVVYDECQELRRRKDGDTITRKWGSCHVVSAAASWRLGLSATPVANYGGEMWNVMECLRPGMLGEWGEFRREWCQPGGEERKTMVADPRAFGLYLRESGAMLARTRSEVGRELPRVTVVPHTVSADPDVLRNCRGKAEELARAILDRAEKRGFDIMKAAGELDKLWRQATGIAKAPEIAAYLRMLVEEGERPVCGLWHRAVYDVVLGQLGRDVPASMYTGSESPRQKEQAKQDFLSGRTRVLLISVRSGSGLDGLQGVSRTVVHGELDWSPAMHDQLTGRVDRDGQLQPVFAHWLLAEVGSDPTIADVLGVKRAQQEPIRDPLSRIVGANVDRNQARRLAEAVLARH